MSRQPSATVTMLFSDMEGSTALLRRLGDDYRDLLTRQRALLREIWQRHGGLEGGTEGDSFFVTFRSATDGVSAALDAQRVVATEPWVGGVRVRLRIGLHTGEPLEHAEGFVGMDVHRAARIAGVAHGGQVLLSEVTRQLVMGRLPDDAGLLDLGHHQLKDLPHPEHIYQLTAAGLQRDFPRLRVPDSDPPDLLVLGPLAVRRGDRSLPLGGPQQRAVLAVLAVNANRTVTAQTLASALWGAYPGPTAPAVLKRHVAALQKLLGPPSEGGPAIQVRRHGYELRVDPESLDLLRFQRHVTAASKALADDHFDQAVRGFNQALRLWRGEPLADLPLDHLGPTVEHLEELRLSALEGRFEAELGSGRHGELVDEIQSLLDEHPFRERLWGQLMLALHRSGMSAEALAAYRRASNTLTSGPHPGPGPELRDLARRIEDNDPGIDAPAGAARPQVKLPVPLHDLLGRQEDLGLVVGKLAPGGARVVTLTGPGGVGKTRLAVEAAGDVVDHFPGGVFFVPLANLSDPELVLAAVAAVLEVRETPDEPLLQSVATSLGSRRSLLVLDNLEQVPQAARVVADLLEAAPATHLLATSQRSLRLGAEHTHEVTPLEVPPVGDPGRRLSIEDVRDNSAIELFVTRARAVRPDFLLDDSNARTVADICRRLDGVPLAIELAAARSALLAPAQLLSRLDRQLTFLTGGRDELPERHRTLRATVEWSYQLLDPRRRALLARLGALAGSFSIEQAQVVASQEGLDSSEDDVLEGLLDLVECSLVRRLPGQLETRFRLLETVQQYAAERLAESGHEVEVRRRLGHDLLTRTEAALADLDGSEAPQVVAGLRQQDPALRSSLEWAITSGHAELAARLAVSLRVYWLLEGRLTEGRRWLARVLELEELPPRLAVHTHLAAGILAYFQDDALLAREHLEAALAGAREEADEEAVALALGYLGALVLGSGDPGQALSMVEEASSIAVRRGFYEGRVLSLSLAAVIAAMDGDLAREAGFYAERLELARRRGDCRRIAETLGNLADIALAQGSVEQAAAYAEEALKLARGVARMVTRDALLTLGRIELASGRPTSATEVLQDALRLSLDLGQVFEAAQSLTALAGVASAEDDHPRAARLFGAGERWQQQSSPLGVELEPELVDHRRRTREALGEDVFRAAELDGAALSLEAVAAVALDSHRT